VTKAADADSNLLETADELGVDLEGVGPDEKDVFAHAELLRVRISMSWRAV
jgi:hypothetical protein